MKRIDFRKIRLRNFLSFGPEPVELEIKSGLNFITGRNLDKIESTNGVGKSTLILDSISFLLFASTFRKINNKDIPHNNTRDSCIVEGWFDINNDNYEIVRSLNPSKVILKKNGNDISKTIPETNKDIIDILGISEDVFTNTIVMTNRDSNSFFNQKSLFKTKFLEGILSLEIFSRMYDDIKITLNEKTKELTKIDTQLKEISNSIRQDEDYETRENKRKNDEIQSYRNKINELQNKTYTSSSINIEELNARKTEIASLLQEIDDRKIKGRDKLNNVKRDIQELTKQYNALCGTQYECPTCKRPYDACNDKELIEKEKKETSIALEDARQRYKKINDIITKLNDKESSYNTEVNKINSNITSCQQEDNRRKIDENNISQYKNEIEKLQNKENAFTEKIQKSKNRLANLQNEYDQLNSYIKLIDAIKHITSPNGVKTLVIKKIINTINDRINYYLKRLDAPCTIEFDEFFEEKFFNLNGKEIGYGSLSGGEAKRVDFALLFTFRDIRRLQSNVIINITVMDEILDSAVDSVGLNSMINLIKENVNNTNEAYYVISHRQEALDNELDVNKIILEKKNGITTII
jgi:DNA repair exonuclease SbcCD ATPase subunit